MKTRSPATTGLLALTLSIARARQGKWQLTLPLLGFRPSRPPRARTMHHRAAARAVVVVLVVLVLRRVLERPMRRAGLTLHAREPRLVAVVVEEEEPAPADRRRAIAGTGGALPD